MMEMETGKLAIVGIGNWGKHLLRNFSQILGEEQIICYDVSEQRLEEAKEQYPAVSIALDFSSILENKSVLAVVIATPAVTHYSLAKRVLEAGKHVLVEKPLAMSIEEAEELIRLAQMLRRKLMVDHLLEYHPAVEEMKRIMQRGELGQIFYLYSQRLNLGIVRTEENALWSLGPHDISVILYLLEEEPLQVAAQGGVYLQRKMSIEDVVFVSLIFRSGTMANLHLSWLDPYKVRRVVVVGSKKMLVFDDMEEQAKLKLKTYGAIRIGSKDSEYKFQIKDEGMTVLPLAPGEPLRKMCLHFLECIEQDKSPRSDGYDGLRVLRVLEAAQKSLKAGGKPIKLK